MARFNDERAGSGTRVRLVFEVNGKRKRIDLGSKLAAGTRLKLLTIVNELEQSLQFGIAPTFALQDDFNSLGSELRAKLIEAGLWNAQPIPTLQEFLHDYISRKSDIVDHTRYKMQNSAKFFCDHFGTTRAIASITSGDAEDYVESRKKLASDNYRRGKAWSTIFRLCP